MNQDPSTFSTPSQTLHAIAAAAMPLPVTREHVTGLGELALLVSKLEDSAQRIRALPVGHPERTWDALEDRRTDAFGELLCLLDKLAPGYGTRLQYALYPFTAPEAKAADTPAPHQPPPAAHAGNPLNGYFGGF